MSEGVLFVCGTKNGTQGLKHGRQNALSLIYPNPIFKVFVMTVKLASCLLTYLV